MSLSCPLVSTLCQAMEKDGLVFSTIGELCMAIKARHKANKELVQPCLHGLLAKNIQRPIQVQGALGEVWYDLETLLWCRAV
jgi:hypothetical protein